MNKSSKEYKNLEDLYPLSPMQEGLLFHSLYEPDSDAYFIQSVFELLGDMDPSLFRQAWQHVINHHAILRTGFVWQELDSPLQYVLKSVEVSWIVEDWSHLSEEEQEDQIKEILLADRKNKIDLSKAPLYRLRLIQLSSERHYLIWSQHHILLDGWCMPLILSDMLTAYDSLSRGEKVHLAYNRPYQDYIQWLQEQDLPKAEEFWREYLSGFEQPTRISLKETIKAEEFSESDYGRYNVNLASAQTERLKAFAQQNHLTLNTIVQGAWAILLSRYTHHKDLVFGVTVSGRAIDLQGADEMVGLFINALPLRIELKVEDTFLSIANRLQEEMVKINQYTYTSLAQIQSWKEGSKNSDLSLFDHIIGFHNYPVEAVSEGRTSLQLRPVEGIERTEYPLTVTIIPDKELMLQLMYQREHFDEESIKRLGGHLEKILENIVDYAKKPISELPLLTDEERHQLLIEWNDTKANYHADKTIQQLFEEQVTKTPNNIAVVYEDESLTYTQLNERANQLAHYLRSLGVGPDTLVAIAIERSLEMVVGILGILKAGGAYVPLDPSYPGKRLEGILEDINTPIILTDRKTIDEIPATLAQVIRLDDDWSYIGSFPIMNPDCITSPGHLAYVIYTSGSTGKPKGVEIEHASILNLLNNFLYKGTTHTRETYACWTSIGFDVSVYEIWFALANGHHLHIIPENIRDDAHKVFIYFEKNQINCAYLPPFMLSEFSNWLRINSEKINIKKLLVGVEPINIKTLSAINNQIPQIEIINGYGPTESTICATLYRFSLNSKAAKYLENVSIGRPVSNTQIYILNKNLEPTPIGVIGELHIGGVGLARGYLNQPDLTAERFIPNPFLNEGDFIKKGARDEKQQSSLSLRLYSTGDLARYLPDGNIEFLGRVDDQVKIRGYRIELVEIESTLNAYGDVAQVVVMVREDEPGDKKLVAYVIPREERLSSFTPELTLLSSSGESFSVLTGETVPSLTEDLRNHLARLLPNYMVPSFFVYLDQFPLTPNGKIDRKIFPAPDLSLRQIGEEYVEPRTSLEQDLCNIWLEVLQVKKIGIHDNFFRIGGDSIISIQLVSKARQKGVYLAVKDIFSHPTIASLASIVKHQENIVALQPDSNIMAGEVPLTPIQHWFFNSNFAEPNHFNQPILLLARKKLDLSLLNQAFSQLISHHDVLRCRYSYDNHNKWKQGCLDKVDDSPCIIIDLSSSKDDELPLDIEKESTRIQQTINIEQGPLLRACLFECGADRPQHLLIVIHHLVVDGVSWRILLEDLETAYNQLAQGKEVLLPTKTHSYQQWAQLLKGYAQSEDLKQQLSYWQTIEQSIQPLPIDFNKDPATGSSTHTIFVSLTEVETIALLQEVPKAYRTQINDILLTALTLAVGDWTNNYELSLSLEGHGREEIIQEIDLSRTVGWFTSIFPVYLKIEHPHDLGAAIKTIKENLRQIPHKGISYGILAYLNQDSSLSLHHYPTLSFNYLGQWDNTTSQKKLFSFAQESAGLCVADMNEVSYLLNINTEVKEKKLGIFLTYSTYHYKTETIERLAQGYKTRLKEIINHCSQKEVFEYTPSDFDLTTLDQVMLIDHMIKENQHR